MSREDVPSFASGSLGVFDENACLFAAPPLYLVGKDFAAGAGPGPVAARLEYQNKEVHQSMGRIIPPYGDVDAYVESNPFMAHNHIRVVDIVPDGSGDYRAEVAVDLVHESMNLNGAVHGGLIYGLADCVAGLTARCDGEKYVTQSSHVNFIRNVRSGTVKAVGEVVRRGRRIVIVHVTVLDSEGRLLADCAMDMMRTQP